MGTPPAAAQIIIDAWTRYKAVADAYLSQVDALHKAEKAVRPGVEDYNLVTDIREATPKIKEIAEGARNQLIRLAERHFAPGGARLDIALPDEEELPAGDLDDLNLALVWDYLCGTYGGEGGARKAYGDIARKLGKHLAIKVGMEPKVVGGRAVFDVSVYGDRAMGDLMSYQDRDRLCEVFDGFLAVAEWSGVWNDHEQLSVKWARSDIEAAYMKKILPERRSIGDSVLVVPFKSKWEFRIAPAFGTQVQLFLSEFDGFVKPRSW